MTNERFKISSDVMSRRLGGETVLLHVADGTYFALDSVGSDVWDYIEQGLDVPQIVECMLARYEVDRIDLERDIRNLMARLTEKKLVMPV